MAETDPYKILGVERSADAEAIRRAYRKLAKQHHPDLNPGNKDAEDRFKSVSAAYELLSDAEKRARFDRGEIDASGQERAPQHGYREWAEGAQGRRYHAPGGAGAFGEHQFNEEELGDILGAFFRARGGEGAGQGESIRMRGRDQAYQLEVSFADSVLGATRRLTLPDGRTLDVTVPPGLTDGQVLRLRGQGGAGLGGGPSGDALIEVHVAPDPQFSREGNDVRLTLPVSLTEAVLGARIAVPTVAGPVSMTVPKHSDTGTKLRLRGRGVAAHGSRAAGDQIVTLQVVIGEADEALENFLRDWGEKHPGDPRRGMGGR